MTRNKLMCGVYEVAWLVMCLNLPSHPEQQRLPPPADATGTRVLHTLTDRACLAFDLSSCTRHA